MAFQNPSTKPKPIFALFEAPDWIPIDTSWSWLFRLFEGFLEEVEGWDEEVAVVVVDWSDLGIERINSDNSEAKACWTRGLSDIQKPEMSWVERAEWKKES